MKKFFVMCLMSLSLVTSARAIEPVSTTIIAIGSGVLSSTWFLSSMDCFENDGKQGSVCWTAVAPLEATSSDGKVWNKMVFDAVKNDAAAFLANDGQDASLLLQIAIEGARQSFAKNEGAEARNPSDIELAAALLTLQ